MITNMSPWKARLPSFSLVKKNSYKMVDFPIAISFDPRV